jgi:hypothetical protein
VTPDRLLGRVNGIAGTPSLSIRNAPSLDELVDLPSPAAPTP